MRIAISTMGLQHSIKLFTSAVTYNYGILGGDFALVYN